MIKNPIDRFVYYPMSYPAGDWDLQAGSGATDCWLKTADNVELNAWWFRKPGVQKPGPRFATLFLHGNAGNVTHRIDHAEAITSAGASVLVLDYRGYGKSRGRPSEQGLYRDAEAGYDELVSRGYGPSQIIIHGESIGSAVATHLATKRPCAGLILEAPMTSLGTMAGIVAPIIGPLLVRGFDTKAKIGRVNTPLLIIHGQSDEVVPFAQGEQVFRSAKEPKTFWQVPNAHHNDLIFITASEYTRRLRTFYESL